jgi:acyl-CoA thioesterase
MFELDEDSRATPIEGGRYQTTISDRWSIGTAPNGGYLARVLLAGIEKALPHPDPFSMTTHFLATARPGPAELRVEVVRAGKGHSTAQCSLFQEGKELCRALAVMGDLGKLDGPSHVTIAPPPLPPPDACERGRAGPTAMLSIADRLDIAMAPGAVSWMPGPDGAPRTRSNVAELSGWMRFRDGRPTDTASLVFWADAMPPPILNLEIVRTPWVPTLELTVHVRARPAPGWLRAVFRTHALAGGYLEEDGELWDEDGKLVAMSRQLARVQRV